MKWSMKMWLCCLTRVFQLACALTASELLFMKSREALMSSSEQPCMSAMMRISAAFSTVMLPSKKFWHSSLRPGTSYLFAIVIRSIAILNTHKKPQYIFAIMRIILSGVQYHFCNSREFPQKIQKLYVAFHNKFFRKVKNCWNKSGYINFAEIIQILKCKLCYNNQSRMCGKGVGLGLFSSDLLESQSNDLDKIRHIGP